jgi:hypothetical protein
VTISDLGEVTHTATEWSTVRHRRFAVDEFQDPMTEAAARERIASYRRWLDQLGTERQEAWQPDTHELVSRTVTEYASGHRLTGPWKVTE